MGVEKYLVLVFGSKRDRFLCERIEINLILEWGSNWLDFCNGVEMNLISVPGSEFDLVLMLGSKVTCFLCGGSELTVCGPTLTFFECDGLFIWCLCAL